MSALSRQVTESATAASLRVGHQLTTEGRTRPARRLQLDIAPAAIVKVLGTLAALWLLANTWQIIVWLAISLMFVATFSPFIRRLQARIQRGWAITLIVTITILAVTALLALIIPSLIRQGENLAGKLPQIVDHVNVLARRLGLHVNLTMQAQRWTARASQLIPQLIQFSLLLLSGAIGIFTVFVLTVYLLIEGPKVGNNLLSLLPRSERLPARRMFGEIGLEVGAYVRGQLITSALAGLFSLILLSVLRVPEPLALAFLMAVADLIPMIGPLLGLVPAVLIALGQGTPIALAVLVGYLIYHQVEGNLIVPWIYGSTLELSPFIVLVAFLVGGELMGILGALLALPVAAAIPIMARYIAEWHARSEAEDTGPRSLPQ